MLRSIVSKNLYKTSFRTVAKRTYAEGTATGLKLQFSLPHETLYSGTQVNQVNLPAQSGKMGILPNHVPTIEQLSPGVVEIFEEGSGAIPKKYFISGGFATVQPDSVLSITAAEAFPLDYFSPETVRSMISEVKGLTASSDEKLATESRIQLEVLEELEKALS